MRMTCFTLLPWHLKSIPSVTVKPSYNCGPKVFSQYMIINCGYVFSFSYVLSVCPGVSKIFMKGKCNHDVTKLLVTKISWCSWEMWIFFESFLWTLCSVQLWEKGLIYFIGMRLSVDESFDTDFHLNEMPSYRQIPFSQKSVWGA